MQTPPVCNYEGSDYQTSFWEKGGRDYEDGCEAVALKRLLPAAGSRLLELGAGAGRNTSRYSGYAQVTLLDFSRTQLEQAKARLGTGERYRYIAADIYRLPFVKGLFDGATMIRTLHHMAEPALALAQVRRVLEPEATFILEYANKRNLKSILRYLLGRQKWSPYTREAVEYIPLNFDFHPAAIRDWMDGAGFILERALTVSHFRVSFLKKTLPVRLLVAVDALLQPTGGLFQLTPSVFLRARALKTGVKAPQGAFFACPACAAPLDDTPPLIHCPACEKQYPVIDDIYDFRLNPPAEGD
ncbi:MAG TPA: class I SAM-dependent methyltransferase [Anaerolineaceae bacterium]|mgnify:FL=1|nr:class I SAM-dependent methyltransferase [Anaerolineaceae bacterium]HOS53389.1 class I SAM-dependent methyltransferase [Anaerolineaceae bacterium]HPD61877.1 class I SAM-dependent methyltransferase [Anaerolineaceae bacterium]HQF68235.1 class I SAM-dependent methyltransferase [Anaerolineaceae bacterium]HQK05467.1 class I SAM-dependent methyltransferase [Anaerolineaceae bacterium]